jgi:hypothetical protein
MTTRDVGTTLRLLGPGLQVACLFGLFAAAPGAAPGVSGGGRLLLYAGFAAGLVLVLIGNLLSRAGGRARPGSRERSLDLRLGPDTPVPPSPSTERNPGSLEIR